MMFRRGFGVVKVRPWMWGGRLPCAHALRALWVSTQSRPTAEYLQLLFYAKHTVLFTFLFISVLLLLPFHIVTLHKAIFFNKTIFLILFPLLYCSGIIKLWFVTTKHIRHSKQKQTFNVAQCDSEQYIPNVQSSCQNVKLNLQQMVLLLPWTAYLTLVDVTN